MPRAPALNSLPILQQTWEIAILPAPPVIDGVRTRGFVLVADFSSRALRLAAPLPLHSSASDILSDAMRFPQASQNPGRPRAVHVSDSDLLAELKPALAEAGVMATVVDSLPAVAEALATMMADAGVPQAPGLTGDLPAWRVVLEDLARLAPWLHIDRGVQFEFARGLIPGGVAVVIGSGDQNRGVQYFPSVEDFFADEERAPHAGFGEQTILTLLLEPSNELTAAERQECRRTGMVFSDELHAKAYATCGGALAKLTEAEERVMLRVVQAVVAVASVSLASLSSGVSRARTVRIPSGQVVVSAGRGIVARPRGAQRTGRRALPGGKPGWKHRR